MFTKILVANRGEIAIRAFRAAYELGAKTVAVYPYEDRNSLHRLKADEAYQIGEPGHPVRAYLDVSEIIRVAKRVRRRRDLPRLRLPLREPRARPGGRRRRHHLHRPGPSTCSRWPATRSRRRSTRSRRACRCSKSTPASRDIDELIAQADEIGFPIFAKAVAGGGGRGMRRVNTQDDLRAALEAAMREADSAFGDPTMFLEQAVLRPRHIEVQILADATGETVHLFERDCSVQRRHQKVIEIAPAPNLDDDDPRRRSTATPSRSRSRSATSTRAPSSSCSTPSGERAGQHVFIEMNPRIQVEHTVTEEVTDVDLVQSQMRIAAGETLADLGLHQDADPPARRRPAVPHHDRGPGRRIPARHRQDHDLPLAGRRRHPPRRRHGRRRARRSARTSTRCSRR